MCRVRWSCKVMGQSNSQDNLSGIRMHSRLLAASWDRGWIIVTRCSLTVPTETLTSCSVCRKPSPCCLQLQPLNISWTTVTEPALAANPAADQLQTRQTLLSGYFFPTARLRCWFDRPIQPVSFAAIIHTEASVSSTSQLGYCCSSFLCCCSETLELSLSSTELSNCTIR